jgi:ADP-heptose:LPS heptosyltransferase
MNKVFWIDGGAGRVIAAIPALLKYDRLNPNTEWSVIAAGWNTIYWGIPELQDRTYGLDDKGVFDNVIKKADIVVTPEPYRNPAYFKQEISLVEAFDREINGSTDHSDLGVPKLVFNKAEINVSLKTISELKERQKKQKTVVFQPFGRGAQPMAQDKDGHTIEVGDEESRSLSSAAYLSLAKKLSLRYNLIFFGEPQFQLKQDTYASNFTCDLRQWGSLIEESDYFVGVDSVGQHMARAVGTPGTVIFGSTFPINTSYPDYFNIIEKEGVKKYSPIRLMGLDVSLSNRINDKLMDFEEVEVAELFKKIVADIEKKVK